MAPPQAGPIFSQTEDTLVPVSHSTKSPGRCYILPRTPSMTSIMPPEHSFKSDSNNGPSPGHLNLVSDGVTSVHVSYLRFAGRRHIWPRAAGLTSVMASEVTQIVVPFCPPWRLFKSDSPCHSSTELQA